MRNEISKRNVKMYKCKVEFVHDSGMIDARAEREGRFFPQANPVFSGIDGSYQEGDKCLILSDGAQYWAVGLVRDPRKDADGNTTTRDLRNDLGDLVDAKTIASTDDYGNQTRVVVSKGGGVLVDSGETSVSHWDPANEKISHYSERSETITVPQTTTVDHDGFVCNIKTKMRTLYDPMSVDADYDNNNLISDVGPTMTVDYGSDADGLSIKNKNGGQDLTTIDVSNFTGDVTVKTLNGEITISSGGGDINVETSTGKVTVKAGVVPGTITVENNKVEMETATGGKVKVDGPQIYLGGLSASIGGILQQLFIGLAAAQTITLIGPSPLLPFAPGALGATLNGLNGTIKATRT